MPEIIKLTDSINLISPICFNTPKDSVPITYEIGLQGEVYPDKLVEEISGICGIVFALCNRKKTHITIEYIYNKIIDESLLSLSFWKDGKLTDMQCSPCIEQKHVAFLLNAFHSYGMLSKSKNGCYDIIT